MKTIYEPDITSAIHTSISGVLPKKLVSDSVLTIIKFLRLKMERKEVFSINNFGTFSYGFEKSPIKIDSKNLYRWLIRFSPNAKLVSLVRSRTKYIKDNLDLKDLEL
jgi:hypothetical protein